MITVGIITKNEKDNIAECIRSAEKITGNILVIDSFSQDNTADIAMGLGARVLENRFEDFVTQKNLLIDSTDTEWIFILDADERITDELSLEIAGVMQKPEYDGYYIPRKSFYMDRFINHSGWYPDYVMKLFKVSRGRFSGRLVHETVCLKGNAKKLHSHLLHYPYKSLSHHIDKINHYTQLYAEGHPGKKSSVIRAIFNAQFKFIKTFVFQLGFLDGKTGFILSIMASYYTLLKYLKIMEKKQKSKTGK